MLTHTQHLTPPGDVQLIALSQYSYSHLCGYCTKITFGATKSILDKHSKEWMHFHQGPFAASVSQALNYTTDGIGLTELCLAEPADSESFKISHRGRCWMKTDTSWVIMWPYFIIINLFRQWWISWVWVHTRQSEKKESLKGICFENRTKLVVPCVFDSLKRTGS